MEHRVTPTFLLDFPDLRNQKLDLLEMYQKEGDKRNPSVEKRCTLDAMVALIDMIQDAAVEVNDVPEDEVFGTVCPECEQHMQFRTLELGDEPREVCINPDCKNHLKIIKEFEPIKPVPFETAPALPAKEYAQTVIPPKETRKGK